MSTKLSKLRRRDFLKLAGVGGLALSIPIFGSILSGQKHLGQSEANSSFQTSFNAIGTTVSLIIDDDIPQNDAVSITNSLSIEISNLERVMTRFPGGTDLCLLNETGSVECPSKDLVELAKSAQRYSESTEGGFDVTVKPALDLLQGYLEGQPFPTDSQFEHARSLINYEKMSISGSLITLDKPGMGITLDGIGTGYILDSSISFLKSKGIHSALVNFGGTLATLGTRADGSPWEVGVVDPTSPTYTLGTLYLKNQAVATSGDYEDYFTPDKKYYHIIDPSTARSPLLSHSATVVAPTGAVADPLGVALMVENPDSGLKFIDASKAECLIYTRSGGVVTSSGMKSLMTN
jgi:FAD:protein FMN transferase